MSSGGESVAGFSAPYYQQLGVLHVGEHMSISMRPMVTWGAILANET